MVKHFVQTEPFLQLFIPDAACLECSHHGGFASIDVTLLLKFVGPDMVVECIEMLELMMGPESLVSSFCDQSQCLLAVALSWLLCSTVRLFLLLVI